MDWRKQLDQTLTQKQESEIRAWLTSIEETDAALITEVIDKCREDAEARQYFLQRAEEVLHTD